MKPNKKKRVSQALTAAALLAGISAPIVETYIVSQSDSALRVYAATDMDTAVANFAKLYSNRDYSVKTNGDTTITEGQTVWIALTNDNGDIVKYLKVTATADTMAMLNDKTSLGAGIAQAYVSGDFKDANITNMMADGGIGQSDAIMVVSTEQVTARLGEYTQLLARLVSDYEAKKDVLLQNYVYSTQSNESTKTHRIIVDNQWVEVPISTDAGQGYAIDPKSPDVLYTSLLASTPNPFDSAEFLTATPIENSGGDLIFNSRIMSSYNLAIEWKDGKKPTQQAPGQTTEYSFRIAHRNLDGTTTPLFDWDSITVSGSPTTDSWTIDDNTYFLWVDYATYPIEIYTQLTSIEAITYDESIDKAKGCIPLPKDNVNGN